MGFIQKSGSASDEAQIKNGKVQVEAVSKSEASTSTEHNKTFVWNSTYTTGGGGEEVIYIQNTSKEDNLIIDKVIVGSAVAQTWTLFSVTSGTAAGTTITGSSTILESGVTPEATSFGNASVTGSLSGDTVAMKLSVAGESVEIDLLGAITVGSNRDIAITASGTGLVYVTVLGHYI